MFRGLYFIIFINNISTSSCAIDALYETGQQVWKLYTIIDNMGSDILYDAKATDNPMIQEMKEQVDKIHKQLNQLEEFMGPKEIRAVIKSWSLSALAIRDIDTMELFIKNIDECYKNFTQYRSESYTYHLSFEVLMKRIFLTLEDHIGIIRKFVSNERKSLSQEDHLVAVIAGYAVVHGAEICGTPQVISDILIQLFRMITIAELKASTILAHENVYGYIESEDKEAWQRRNSLAREILEKQFAIYINIFSFNMAVIDVVYNRACDPPGGQWIRDESFYELEKTFQTIIFGFKQTYCESETCNYIWLEKPRQCRPLFHEEPIFRSPEDNITECAYLNQIKACSLNSGPYRFQYVNSSELGFLGRSSSCPRDNGQLVETGMEAGHIYAACACNFYSNHNKISLFMIESDVESNKVITGLRFVRKNEVLYIQPREGRLQYNSHIDEYSQRWIPIPEYIHSSLIEPINRTNGVFFLDDIVLPINYVLTGVKFIKVTRENVSGFAIEILGTHFNYKTGRLSFSGRLRQFRKGSNEKSGQSLSFNRVSSLFTRLPHSVTPSDIKYITLERSTLKEDFGQSTLPLFDAVPITFRVPSPLGGVGMFHKGVEGYAGLISLRLYGINYREYFNDFKVFHIINDRVLFNSSSH